MKNLQILAFFALSVLIFGCPGPKPVPTSELIKKSWSASLVKENGTIVYTKGATSNTRPGYSNFRLGLSATPSASYTEFDGNSFSGQYELVGDTKLVLKGLSPVPTGTGGTVEFTINSISETQLILNRTSASAKTGNTVNEYTLVTP